MNPENEKNEVTIHDRHAGYSLTLNKGLRTLRVSFVVGIPEDFDIAAPDEIHHVTCMYLNTLIDKLMKEAGL